MSVNRSQPTGGEQTTLAPSGGMYPSRGQKSVVLFEDTSSLHGKTVSKEIY